MAELGRERLLAELPRLTAGGTLSSTPFLVNGRRSWVSVTVRVVELRYHRVEEAAEVAHVGEVSVRQGERRPKSRYR